MMTRPTASSPTRLCLVTPWPPQHTGIADYAYDLAKGLVQLGHQVVVVTEAKEAKALPGVQLRSPDWLDQKTVKEVDGLIYQIGNNSNFHIFQLALLARYPGVVHLHDQVLHHLMAWILYLNGSPQLYRAALAKWYGPRIAGWVAKASLGGRQIWETPAVMHVPFFEETMQHASGLITNSHFSSRKVGEAFPSLPRLTLPQLYQDVVPHVGSASDEFHIGVLGGIDPNKRIDLVWKAVSTLMAKGLPVHLHLAGSVSVASRALIEQMQDSPHADRIHLHGRVDDARFVQLLSELDLCVALRFPSMGETSAVVMRALQAGTPTLVNDIAWYSELPDFVPKIIPGLENEEHQLAQLITSLSTKGKAYLALKEQGRQWTEKELDFNMTTSKYADFCLDIGKT